VGLAQTAVGDAGLKSLLEIKTLGSVSASKSAITDAAVAAAKASHPNARISK
jgi:hypothetical protein